MGGHTRFFDTLLPEEWKRRRIARKAECVHLFKGMYLAVSEAPGVLDPVKLRGKLGKERPHIAGTQSSISS